jgi:alpha-beta hydrolase superfamily lysophospholipase
MYVLEYIFIGLGLIYVVSLLVISCITYLCLCRPRFYSLEETLQRCYKRNEFKPGILELPWEYGTVFSPRRKASLATAALPGTVSPESAGAGTVIILHGITWTRYGGMKYAAGFIERGWNVVLFDLGGHGASPAGSLPAPAYGYYERYDLDAVVDWTRSRFPGKGPLVLIGESMGAATVLQYAPLGAPLDRDRRDWKMDVLIADCSYTSLAEELLVCIKSIHIPSFLAYPVRGVVGFFLKRFRGYGLFDAAPQDAVLASAVPVLFIHGKEDNFIPFRMSVRMEERRRQAGFDASGLVLIEGAAHAMSILTDAETWYREVFAFIGRQV